MTEGLRVGDTAAEHAEGVSLRRLPQPIAQQYRKMVFSPAVPNAPGFCWDTLDQWAELTQRATDLSWRRAERLERQGQSAYAAAIRDQVNKAQVNWRVHGYGAGMQLSPVVAKTGAPYFSAIRPYMDKLTKACLAVLDGMDTADLSAISIDKPYPIWKGKGAPSFLSGKDWDLAPALARIVDLDQTADMKRINDHVKGVTDWGGGYLGATYFRAQGRNWKKPGEYWVLSGDDLIYQGDTWIGNKTRKVTGIPFGLNFWCAPIVACMRECMITASGGRFSGKLGHVEKISKQYPNLLAADASNFDDSQCREAILHWVDHAFAPFAAALAARGVISFRHSKLAVVTLRYAVTIPCLITPASLRELGRIIQNEDGVLSGLRPTSVLDTWLNSSFIEWLMETSGYKLGRTYDYDAFGDDTLVAASGSYDQLRERWEVLGNKLGTTYGISEEPAFLMRRVPSMTPYPDRFWIRTLNREEREEPTSVPAAVLGMQGRLAMLEGEDRQHLRNVYTSWLGVNERLDAAITMALNGPDVTRIAFAPPAQLYGGGEDVPLEYLSRLYDESQSAGSSLPAGLSAWLAENAHLVAPAWKVTMEQAGRLTVQEASRLIRRAAPRSLKVGESAFALSPVSWYEGEQRQQKRRGI